MQLDDNYLRFYTQSSMPLDVEVVTICNTDSALARRNFDINFNTDYPLVKSQPERLGRAVICGKADSLADYSTSDGDVIFACNSASHYLTNKGIIVDYQVMMDVGDITFGQYDKAAKCHLLACTVHPELICSSKNPLVWIPGYDWMMVAADGCDKDFDYIGGGVMVGNFAVALAYTLGFRDIAIYGVSGSYGQNGYYSNDIAQAIVEDAGLPVMVEYDGIKYQTSFALKQSAQAFRDMAKELVRLGASVKIYGAGLIPAIFNKEIANV